MNPPDESFLCPNCKAELLVGISDAQALTNVGRAFPGTDVTENSAEPAEPPAAQHEEAAGSADHSPSPPQDPEEMREEIAQTLARTFADSVVHRFWLRSYVGSGKLEDVPDDILPGVLKEARKAEERKALARAEREARHLEAAHEGGKP